MLNYLAKLSARILIGCAIVYSPMVYASTTHADKVLSEKEVVASAVKNYPKILSHYDKIKAAESNLLASKGFFDIKLKQSYSDRSRGYYDGKSYNVELEKELGILGSKVYSGYRKSYGSFPDYEGGSYTNSGGEYRAGAKFSLLKDSTIDSNRLRVILANLSVDEAKIEMENIKKEIERDARKAYWTWVTDGEIYKIYEDLYQLALTRQKQLETRAKSGDIAEITLVENQKNILKRKSSLAKIKQEFENSAIYLSLFWRDSHSKPILPKKSQLPKLENKTLSITKEKLNRDVDNALRNRPEINLTKLKLREENSNLDYAKNILKPQLDVDFGVSDDVGKGPKSRGQSNNYAKVDFSVPLQQREAKGKIAATEAKINAIKYEQQLFEEKIGAQINQLQNKITTVCEVHKNIEEEAKLAEVLEVSERERFKQGASNLFMVNSREQDSAASRAALVEVFRDYKELLADYDLAVFADN